jgi:hypothetical protein
MFEVFLRMAVLAKDNALLDFPLQPTYAGGVRRWLRQFRRLSGGFPMMKVKATGISFAAHDAAEPYLNGLEKPTGVSLPHLVLQDLLASEGAVMVPEVGDVVGPASFGVSVREDLR